MHDFLLSVSHDLRTPLTSITGWAEALADGAAPDPAAAGAGIGVEAARLDRLVRDLLDLARLRTRAFRLTVSPVDLGDVAAGTAEEAAPAWSSDSRWTRGRVHRRITEGDAMMQAMRTTVTLDPDVAALIRQRMRELGVSFKEAVNDAIRASVKPSSRSKPFRVRTAAMGRPSVSLDRALQLAAELEDEELVRKTRLGK